MVKMEEMKFNIRIFRAFKSTGSMVSKLIEISEHTDFSTATVEEREYCRKLCLRLAKKLRKSSKLIGVE